MHPHLFDLPWGLSANAYGTLILVGGLATVPAAYWDAKQRGIAKGRLASFLVDFYLVLVGGAFFGGRILHVLTVPGVYADDPGKLVALDSTGFVFFGSFIAIILGWLWLARRYQTDLGTLCDLGMTWMGLTHTFGRLGCFMAGCCWGGATEAPWGIALHEPAIVVLVQGAPMASSHATVALHPTALYESLGLCTIWVTLMAIRFKRGPERKWRQACRYLVGYGLLRATVEIFRGDLSRGFVFEWRSTAMSELLSLPVEHPLALSISQAAALGLCAVGLIGLRRLRRSEKSLL